MTVCISAICTEKQNEHIVFAVDHMITTMNGEFEHSIKKYREINKNTVGMIAGDALQMEYLMDLKNFSDDYTKLQKTFEKKIKEKRLEIIQKSILNTFDVDIDFIKENLNEEINNPIMSKIFDRILDTKLGVSILLVGFIEDTAHLSIIRENGVHDFTTIHFTAIGSGAPQAQNTMLFQKQSKDDDLRTTLYNVYKAKKNAEVNRGVGKETEIGYLNKDKIVMIQEKDLKILNDIYEHESLCGKEHEDLQKLEL